MVFLFLIMPILFFVAYFTLLGTVETKVLFLYFTFTLIHTILFTIWFFLVLIDIFEGLKIENAAERRKVVGKATRQTKAVKAEKKEEGEEFEANPIVDLDETDLLPTYQVDKPMTFREDMYSLLYVSLVKPQYKMYCDLVHKTGHALPYDNDEPLPTISIIDKGDTLTEEGMNNSWCTKVKSFICCRRPKFNEDGTHSWTTSKTLILDVISMPGTSRGGKGTQIQDDSGTW